MELSGLVVGMGTVLSIYLSRALCIWGVGYFGRSFWVVFLLLGVVFLGLVLWLGDGLAAELLSVAGFCCLWGVGESFAQVRRIEKGWYPRRGRRH